MPREIKEVKNFLDIIRDKGCKKVTIKKNKTNTKFKVRMSKYLYTLVIKDPQKAQKLQQSLPPGLSKETIGTKRK